MLAFTHVPIGARSIDAKARDLLSGLPPGCWRQAEVSTDGLRLGEAFRRPRSLGCAIGPQSSCKPILKGGVDRGVSHRVALSLTTPGRAGALPLSRQGHDFAG